MAPDTSPLPSAPGRDEHQVIAEEILVVVAGWPQEHPNSDKIRIELFTYPALEVYGCAARVGRSGGYFSKEMRDPWSTGQGRTTKLQSAPGRDEAQIPCPAVEMNLP